VFKFETVVARWCTRTDLYPLFEIGGTLGGSPIDIGRMESVYPDPTN